MKASQVRFIVAEYLSSSSLSLVVAKVVTLFDYFRLGHANEIVLVLRSWIFKEKEAGGRIFNFFSLIFFAEDGSLSIFVLLQVSLFKSKFFSKSQKYADFFSF